MVACGRCTARRDEPFVVFMMGVRVNRFLLIWKWLPVLLSLRAMLREVRENRKSGFLGGQTFFSWRSVTLIQYWTSYEDLERYARDPNSGHLPAWRRFNQKVRRSGAVGLWHEAYTVGAAEYEAIYADVPVSGLAKATLHMPAIGGREAARRRALREAARRSTGVPKAACPEDLEKVG
ncbi:DUF4188 domain-containing protein [Rubrobacter radiotolerans]|nr:DUF4188 domain-containing protein [Rubrobacter radiotolerans]MDX5892612.1 DUF4188 domain-containing protein [Rubrobacter radiotolerans]